MGAVHAFAIRESRGRQAPGRGGAGEDVGAGHEGHGVEIGQRRRDVGGEPRGIFCGIGACYDCLVVVNAEGTITEEWTQWDKNFRRPHSVTINPWDPERHVWVVDDREEYVREDRFPRVQRRIHGHIESVLPSLDVTPDTFCLIVTRGQSHDERALYHLADRGARYVGLIGSRRKLKLIFDDLRQEGISTEALRRVREEYRPAAAP